MIRTCRLFFGTTPLMLRGCVNRGQHAEQGVAKTGDRAAIKSCADGKVGQDQPRGVAIRQHAWGLQDENAEWL